MPSTHTTSLRSGLMRGTATLIGLAAAAAAWGYHVGGVDGALIVPAILHLPLIVAASAVADDVDESNAATSRSSRRTWRDRIATYTGRRHADAVLDRAGADVRAGVWGRGAKELVYAVTGEDRIEPVLDTVSERRLMSAAAVRVRFAVDGSSSSIATIGGKLQSLAGHPSAARIDADGDLQAAAWHDAGVAQRTWSAGAAPLQLTVDAQELAGHCRMLADEVRATPGYEEACRTLDSLSSAAEVLAHGGVTRIPLTVTAQGSVDVPALEASVRARLGGLAVRAPAR